jgi:sestrin 1/3
MKKMFNNDLSIPNEWRYYIAYMAAATHKCEYLMKHEKKLCKLFYQDWLDANQVPDKLKSLGNANVKLAHRPWEFTHEDIKELLSYWNTKELVLALAILCQFHCLSGFVFGIGVAPETIQHRSLLNEPQHLQKTGKTIKTNIVSALKNYSESQEPENEILDSSFEDIPGNEEEIYYSKAAGGYLSYANYDMDTATKHFNASDFKFSDQAYYIIEKIIPEVSESIWNRIRTTFAMTYEHLGGESGVKTKLLRRAIWNYVQRVYGLQYDDFCYTIINKFLHINTKRYIKKVACFPDTVVQEDYENIKLKITDDEMIHLNLIICEARFEAQLVYMLHALQRALDLN